MAVLYLTEQGATLRKDHELFTVTKDGAVLTAIPAPRVEQVVVFGNIGLTTPVIDYLLQSGIDCVFCNQYGKYHGRLFSTESNFGELRRLQYRSVEDRDLSLRLARQFVLGKARNQWALLTRYLRQRGNEGHSPPALAVENGVDASAFAGAQSAATLRGIEGGSSAAYFRAFRLILEHDYSFVARVRRPPTDPVNSLLSFGYTLLAYGIQSAIRTVGLDPFLGYYHTTQYSRPSLALDLMEEWRPIVVDSLVLQGINTGAFSADDFTRIEDTKAVVLTDQARKRFLAAYEERVQTRVTHRGEQVTYRRLFELQARQLARVVTGKQADYQAYVSG